MVPLIMIFNVLKILTKTMIVTGIVPYMRTRIREVRNFSTMKNDTEHSSPAAVKPRPRVAASSILSMGVAAFTLAYVWPPLLLAVALFMSLTIPYR